jgi:hypothetical protein
MPGSTCGARPRRGTTRIAPGETRRIVQTRSATRQGSNWIGNRPFDPCRVEDNGGGRSPGFTRSYSRCALAGRVCVHPPRTSATDLLLEGLEVRKGRSCLRLPSARQRGPLAGKSCSIPRSAQPFRFGRTPQGWSRDGRYWDHVAEPVRRRVRAAHRRPVCDHTLEHRARRWRQRVA